MLAAALSAADEDHVVDALLELVLALCAPVAVGFRASSGEPPAWVVRPDGPGAREGVAELATVLPPGDSRIITDTGFAVRVRADGHDVESWWPAMSGSPNTSTIMSNW